MLKKTSILLFLLLNSLLYAQEAKKGLFSKLEYGFNIGWGHEENFLFDDPDYSYDVAFHKLQIYYPLKKKSRISYEILIQPLNINCIIFILSLQMKKII